MATRDSRARLLAGAVLAGFLAVPAHAQETVPGHPDLLVTTEWLAAHLSEPANALIHVGTDRRSYDAGHIPGARFVAMRELAAPRGGVPNELPPATELAAMFERLGIGTARRVILYGDERGLLAARAFFTMDYLGYGDRAALLDGGLEKWRAEGRPVSTEEPEVTPQPFVPALRPEVLASTPVVRDVSWLLTRSTDGAWALVDARPDAQFTGTEPGADIQRPGHIPGAASLFWERTLVSRENPVLRPVAELRKLYADAGASPRRTVITYCRTGVQASFAYFVARYLGYPVKMYDGSFLEWSRTEGTDVSR